VNYVFFRNIGHSALSLSVLLAVVILLTCHVMQELSKCSMGLNVVSVSCTMLFKKKKVKKKNTF